MLRGSSIGAREGLYWSCFNILEYEGVEKHERRKLLGTYTVVKNIIGVLFPIILGGVIYSGSFWSGTMIMAIFTAVGIILSMMYKDTKQENKGKFSPCIVFKEQSRDSSLLYIGICHVFTGMTYSNGAFRLLADVYILNIFNNSMSAGWITAASSMASCMLGILFVKVLKTGKRIKLANTFSSVATVVTTILLILIPSSWTVIMFYFVFGMYKDVESNIDGILYNNIANESEVLKANKPEYSLLCDAWLYGGRILGYVILVCYAVSQNTIMFILFLVPLIGTMIMFNVLLNEKRKLVS